MRNIKHIPFVLFISLFVSSCKKEKDNITHQTINGMVYNQCTDSGLANVPVFLKINRNNSSVQEIETVSGTNGAFTFANVEIHSNSKYSYAISIHTKQKWYRGW